jgi:four helix bundle protein
MDSEELKARTKQFALRVMKLVGALPRTVVGRVVGGQLVRCGTSVGADYRAACRAWSKAEFNGKLGTVAEEADETCFWLELIIEGVLLPQKRVAALLEESDVLTAIFTSAVKTSRFGRDRR